MYTLVKELDYMLCILLLDLEKAMFECSFGCWGPPQGPYAGQWGHGHHLNNF